MKSIKFERIDNINVCKYKSVVNKNFRVEHIESFIKEENNYLFIGIKNNDIIALLYGYGLLRPDGKSMFYIHSADVLSEYQNQGIGTKLLDYVLSYIKNENKYYKFFVLADIDNIKACKLYQKYANNKEQMLYSNTFEKGTPL